MTRKKTDKIRFGDGEFATPERVRDQARYIFLQAVRDVCPRPLIELRRRIFPLYCAWAETLIKNSNAYNEWIQTDEGHDCEQSWKRILIQLGATEQQAELGAVNPPSYTTGPDAAILRSLALIEDDAPGLAKRLMLWAQRYHLTDTDLFEETPDEADSESELPELTLHERYWACDWALLTMWYWHFNPKGAGLAAARPPQWVPGTFGQRRQGDRAWTLNVPAWEPTIEPEGTFRRRLQGSVQSLLDSHIKAATSAALSQGLKRTPQKLRAHFEWLACYQVSGMSQERIAKAKNAAFDTVKDGIREAAELIQLGRRRSFRGPSSTKRGDLIKPGVPPY